MTHYQRVLEEGMTRHAESRFPTGPATVTAYCATGELVKTLVSDGLKAEGAEALYYLTQELAVDAWKASFDAIWPKGLHATLYWRFKPKLENTPDGWRVYSRLLVSSEPMCPTA